MNVTYIEREGGRNVILTSQEYRVMYYASIGEVVRTRTGKRVGWTLYGNESVTGTARALIRKQYLAEEDFGVHVTGKGRDVMVKYWKKRKELLNGAVQQEAGAEKLERKDGVRNE